MRAQAPGRILTFSAASPAEDLALEEAIQEALEKGAAPPTWRIWAARRPAIVLGTGQRASLEINPAAAAAENIPILRRHSGGGAVLIGPGVWQYSAFLPFAELPGSETISGAMRSALRPVLHVLCAWGASVRLEGLSDVAVNEGEAGFRKIAGNAQARKRVSVLVHGTLLADPDWRLLSALLRFPSAAPEYRAGREHREFLVGLTELRPDSSFTTFGERLTAAICLSFPNQEWHCANEPAPEEWRRAQELVMEKYGSPAWNLRR
jgi:lipoate-protein ligase A